MFVTTTMAVNSPEPNLFSVILWLIWLTTLFNEDVDYLQFSIFVVVVVVVAFIVVWNRQSGTNRYVVIPLGDLVCLDGKMISRGWSDLGGVSGCRCRRRWIGGTVYIGGLVHNSHQLISALHSPPIGTVRPNLKQNWTESLW